MDISEVDVEEIGGLTDEALVGLLHAAAMERSKIEAVEIVSAGIAEERCLLATHSDSMATKFGAKNARELIRRATLASSRAVGARLRLAHATRTRIMLTGHQLPPETPFVAKALYQGFLPAESASHIVGLINRCEQFAHPEDLEAAERDLVEAASGIRLERDPETDEVVERELGPDEEALVPFDADLIRIMCKAWEEALNPDGTLPDEKQMMRSRGVRFGAEKDGLVRVEMDLTPEVAAMLGRVLDAAGNPRVDFEEEVEASQAADEDEEAARDAEEGALSDGEKIYSREDLRGPMIDLDGTEVPEKVVDPRTPDQKRHDLFASVLSIMMRSEALPTLGGAPVTVLIQVDEETLESGKGFGHIQNHRGQPAPVHLSTVRHGACAGVIQRVVQDRNGKITKIGIPDRAFNAHQRRAITARDGGCVIPGCTVPSTWCEIHHVLPHARGGPTHTDNGVLLCWHHHRTLDTSGWDISMEKGVPKVKAPPWMTRLWADLARQRRS